MSKFIDLNTLDEDQVTPLSLCANSDNINYMVDISDDKVMHTAIHFDGIEVYVKETITEIKALIATP